ncbi:putative phosphotyrosine protein phosphatase [Rhodococcoides trifolii]|uniref:Phosphotyrosine protein phosphatase n=1 Tax=Rhodococcoides trifolii TaxID=908250 RepID=A0A917FQI8_9NOCA|nr:tyrosine-protein phosphatase [Rhodococcus trifolii]GGF97711.1 putative phosphotyrosine protein phosphatase [Rhodococcus trifolii]
MTSQFLLSGAWNYRDVGGLRTTDGGIVRSGVLHRASALRRLDDDGRAALADLGITDVFDLRGDAEVEREGADLTPESVRVHARPYWNYRGETAPHEAPSVPDEATAIEHMLTSYTRFPSLDGARDAIRSVVETIVAGEGGVLVHCAAGKDRAGWTVATVLRAAGVTEEDVLADYLRSNDAIDPLRRDVASIWGDTQYAKLTDAMLGVREDYYRAAMAEVNRLHGSFEGYLDALGIDGGTTAKLRSVLVDDAL